MYDRTIASVCENTMQKIAEFLLGRGKSVHKSRMVGDSVSRFGLSPAGEHMSCAYNTQKPSFCFIKKLPWPWGEREFLAYILGWVGAAGAGVVGASVLVEDPFPFNASLSALPALNLGTVTAGT